MKIRPNPDQGVNSMPSKKAIEQSQAATENVREGYGGNLKARLLSAKPDSDEREGPGLNGDNAGVPAKP